MLAFWLIKNQENVNETNGFISNNIIEYATRPFVPMERIVRVEGYEWPIVFNILSTFIDSANRLIASIKKMLCVILNFRQWVRALKAR